MVVWGLEAAVKPKPHFQRFGPDAFSSFLFSRMLCWKHENYPQAPPSYCVLSHPIFFQKVQTYSSGIMAGVSSPLDEGS